MSDGEPLTGPPENRIGILGFTAAHPIAVLIMMHEFWAAFVFSLIPLLYAIRVYLLEGVLEPKLTTPSDATPGGDPA